MAKGRKLKLPAEENLLFVEKIRVGIFYGLETIMQRDKRLDNQFFGFKAGQPGQQRKSLFRGAEIRAVQGIIYGERCGKREIFRVAAEDG